MAYPERGASYRHQPKFLDRALEGEKKRADGGGVDTPLPSVGVPASPEDRAMLNADLPLTPERANQIYDAYERVGGGKDVSDSQFVKNSQFGISPFSGLGPTQAPTVVSVGSSDEAGNSPSGIMSKFLRGLTPK